MRSEIYILESDGTVKVVDLLTWARWFETADCRIAWTEIGESRVSTVFRSSPATNTLGLDHQWGDGPPLIFETMVFGGPLAGEQERYSTKAEAEAGHEAMCQRVREKMEAVNGPHGRRASHIE